MAATETARSAGTHLPIRQDWLDKGREEILEPDLPIVDPHHHLWNRHGHQYFLPELLADTNSGHKIVKTVFIEAGAMYRARGPQDLAPLGEIEFVNGVAAMSASGEYGPTEVCAGIVGYADLAMGGRVEKVLEAELAVSGGRFKGIRFITASHENPAARGSAANKEPGLLTRTATHEGFSKLGPLGLTFDAWMYHTQLPELLALVRKFPEQKIVINHVGGAIGIGPYAGKRDEVFAEWRKHMQALAKFPNLHVKLGGLGMRLFGFSVHEGEMPPGSEALAAAWRPYIDACIEDFGASRAMFESNFPVDKGSCSHAALWNAFKLIAQGCSAEEKTALFSGTATGFYKI